MDIERYVAEKLHELTDYKIVLEIPPNRPDEFVSVELTGSEGGRFLKTATIAVQSWAKTRKQAAAVAATIEHAVRNLIAYEEVLGAKPVSTFRWPDPESRQARYQTVVNLTIYTE